MRKEAALLLPVLGLFAACDSGPAASPAAPAADPLPPRSASFACDPALPPPAEQLRRLTMTQYRNTVRDLVRWALPDQRDADAVIALARLDELPLDRREPVPQDVHGSYRRLDQTLEQQHVDGAFRVATALAAALTEPSRLSSVVGACAADADAANDVQCSTDFIRRFGARVLRRPLDDEDVSFYRSVYGADPRASPRAYADLIAVLFNAPDFLYFVEGEGRPLADQPALSELTAHALAARLSYHFWQTLPDAELWAAAENGSLLEPSIYSAQVDRLAADARTRETLREFFADWLKVEDLPALDAHNRDPVFAAFAGADLPDPALRQAMIDDVLALLAHYTWTEPGGIEELFTSELSFAASDALARIYGVPRWDGVSAPPALPAGARPGLLTRALFLTSGSANTRPIQKGVFLRRRLLCDALDPPPAGVNAMPPELRPDMTTRQVVEELTEQPGTTCAGCHATRINPLGFAFEGFDGLGRARGEQRLFDAQGTLLGVLPVDTRSVPRVSPDDARSASGPAELVRLMLESGKLEACLARNYFRFTFGRWEDPARDGCALERLRARLAGSGQIREFLKEAALAPEFRRRAFD
jgi:hypothetical protein